MAAEIRHCAELHNQIVRCGWHVTSAPFIPFWEKHSQHHTELEKLVSQDVIEFYKKALVPAGSIRAEDPYQNFFYYLRGLARPWERTDTDEYRMSRLGCREDDTVQRLVLFYEATTALGSQQGGIILDQDTIQASVQIDLSTIDQSSMVWQPLSAILAKHLSLVSLGKITSANFKSISETLRAGEIEPQHPWKYHSYSPKILTRTLAAYHGLISAIEAARNICVEDQDHKLTVYLSTHFNLDAACFPKVCFARSFLTAARRPRGPKRIRYIAPGIALPSAMSIRNQLFVAVARRCRFSIGIPGLSSMDEEEKSSPLYPPFLLFPGEGIHQNDEVKGNRAAFAAPFNAFEDCSTGLWLDRAEPWSGRGGEDEAVVVAPLAISRRAYTPFEAGTRLPLFAVLEEWTDMVRNGTWKVDERGVVGGMELLRESNPENGEIRGRSMIRGAP